jgi:hypothetical protein
MVYEMSDDDLVAAYIDDTMFCSFWHHMQTRPAYGPLRARGNDAVPAILRALEREEGGMNLIYILHEITGESPDSNSAIVTIEDGWVKWDVADAASAWIVWGKARGLL